MPIPGADDDVLWRPRNTVVEAHGQLLVGLIRVRRRLECDESGLHGWIGYVSLASLRALLNRDELGFLGNRNVNRCRGLLRGNTLRLLWRLWKTDVEAREQLLVGLIRVRRRLECDGRGLDGWIGYFSLGSLRSLLNRDELGFLGDRNVDRCRLLGRNALGLHGFVGDGDLDWLRDLLDPDERQVGLILEVARPMGLGYRLGPGRPDAAAE